MKLGAILLLVVWVLAARAGELPPLGTRIAGAARTQIGVTTEYNPAYVVLPYPGGDVPLHTGVCTDVVVRALRGVGSDLQKEVHEDMEAHFDEYPRKWKRKTPDKNIDHRRVANLMRFFDRRGLAVAGKTNDARLYLPGDIVAWDLGRGVLHVGIVPDRAGAKAPMVIHNIGSGAKEEDVLFRYEVIGHYRWQMRDTRAVPASTNHPPPSVDGAAKPEGRR